MEDDDLIVNNAEYYLQRALADFYFHQDDVKIVCVRRMGSREYLDTKNEANTDLDLYTVCVTDEMDHQSTDTPQSLAGHRLSAGIAAQQYKILPVVVDRKQALQWITMHEHLWRECAEDGSLSQTMPLLKTDTGLLLSVTATVSSVTAATLCARAMRSGKNDWRDVIGTFMVDLRGMGVLNPYGRGSSAGQHLKTAFFTRWCCVLLLG